jgi:thymidylate synthase
MKVEDIRKEFIQLYHDRIFVESPKDSKTVEIINSCFEANEATIFGEVNETYIKKELDWYKKMSLKIEDMDPPIPKIWKQIASKDGKINSNYGYLVYSIENGSQYAKVTKALLADPTTRQGIMIYTRPSIHVDFNKNEMKDFICTSTVQYLIRDNQLVTIVTMRSNDAIFGYKNDYAWQVYISNRLLNLLNSFNNNYSLGKIFWNVGSLHIYERHFELIKGEL